ncbi:MAG: diguanylate cyclase [Oscillospiraceae bacterium]
MKKSIIRTNLLIALVVIIGFTFTEVSTNVSFKKIFTKDIEYVSKLTSENMYMGIKELMGQPINVSLSMARDNFLRDYMSNEKSGVQSDAMIDTLKKYLSEYKNKNNFDTVFLVSAKTGNYYHYKNGIDRVMSPDNKEDIWYYDFLKSDDEYALNVDNDQATNDNITVFVNCKLKDDKGNILGIIGVGLETPYIQNLLAQNENEYQIDAYLVDDYGNVQLSDKLTEFENVNLFEKPAYSQIKDEIVKNKTSTENKWYESGQESGYFVTRYIPYLNWYLIVEKSAEVLHHKMINQLWVNGMLTIVVLFGVLAVTTIILKKNNKKIAKLAEQDQLTGLKNRTSYERDIEKYKGELKKYQPFGIGVFDLNDLKGVNDIYGHQEGDEYLKAFSEILSKNFSKSPVYRIGGDEFCVILLDIKEENILNNWENINKEFEEYGSNKQYSTSAAFGYTFYDETATNTTQTIFSVADKKMYENKSRYKAENKN